MCSKYPEMVWLLGEVPRWFGSWGKSRYGLVVGGSPDMVWLLGEVPRCDVTPQLWRNPELFSNFLLIVQNFHILYLAVGFSWQTEHRIPRWKRAQNIPRWKMRSNPMLEKRARIFRWKVSSNRHVLYYYDWIFWSKAANKSSGQKYFLKWPSVVLNYRVYLEEQNKTGAKLFRGYHSQFTLNSRPSTQYECSVKYVQYSGTESFHVEVKSMHAVRY